MRNELSIEDQAFNASNLTFGDERLGVQFYNRVVEDVEATLREGRKCFKSREYVRIMVPGDRSNIVDRPVQKTGILPSDDTLRFQQQYARFKARQEQPMAEGTPLGLWPLISETLVEEMKYVNIFTVEQLAEINDSFVGKIPRGSELKRRAQEFVAAMKDQGLVGKLQTELAERDNRIETLERAIADQAAKIEALARKVK